jgi:hypothetical protein
MFEGIPTTVFAEAILYGTLEMYYTSLCVKPALPVSSLPAIAHTNFNLSFAASLTRMFQSQQRTQAATDVAMEFLKYTHSELVKSHSKMFVLLESALKCEAVGESSITITHEGKQSGKRSAADAFDEPAAFSSVMSTTLVVANQQLYVDTCNILNPATSLVPLVIQHHDDAVGKTLDDFIVTIESAFTTSIFMDAAKELKKSLIGVVTWRTPPQM